MIPTDLTGTLCGRFCYNLRLKTQKQAQAYLLIPQLHQQVAEPQPLALGSGLFCAVLHRVARRGRPCTHLLFLQKGMDLPVVNVAETLGKEVALSCSCPSLKRAEGFGSHAWRELCLVPVEV